MNKRLSCLPTLLAGACLATPAQAGRPLQTEDAGILEPAACEVEGAAARLSASGDVERNDALKLSCGIGVSTQWALERGRARGGGAPARSVEVSGKTMVWRGQKGSDVEAPALVLAYALGATGEGGGGWRHASTELSMAYTRPLSDAFALHANLGHARDERVGARATPWGLAVEHAGWGAVAPMAEVFGNDREPAWWNIGLRLTAWPDRLFLDASYGRQMRSGHPALRTLGFKIAL